MARHKFYGTRLYYCWANMKQRCNQPNASGYHKYGGKGITVCNEWNYFDNFKDWALSNGYYNDLTIDRIDSSGNYEPSNCRWATYTTQSRHTKLIHSTNKSGYRGVSMKRNCNKKYVANIQVNKKQHRIGYYDDPKEAAMAYDTFVIVYGLEHTQNFSNMWN